MMAFTQSIIVWPKAVSTSTVNIDAVPPKTLGDYINDAGEAVHGYLPWLPGGTDDEVLPTTTVEKTYNFFQMDSVVSESHLLSNEVTCYPISSGFTVSDHVIKKNFLFGLAGVVVNNKFAEFGLNFTTIGAVAGAMMSQAVGPVIGSLIGQAAHAIDNIGQDGSPVTKAYNQLKDLVRNGTLVHVSTILGTYENCVLRSVQINQDVRTATILPLILQFEQLQVIDQEALGVDSDMAKALTTMTPTDTELLIKAAKASSLNIGAALLGVS
jgi:hypothetical protein